METKQVFLDREEDDLARAVLEKASCMLSDSHIDPRFERHLPERQVKFAARVPQKMVGNGSARVY